MGVDYTGNYGIGVKVYIGELQGEYEDYGDLEYIEEILEDSVYFCFETGSDSYGGNPNEIYICIEEPFKDGFDIEEKVSEFYKFLKLNNIDFEDEVDVVGGLHVW